MCFLIGYAFSYDFFYFFRQIFYSSQKFGLEKVASTIFVVQTRKRKHGKVVSLIGQTIDQLA